LLLYFFIPNPQNSPGAAWVPTDVPMTPYYIERAYLRQGVRFIANGTVQALRFQVDVLHKASAFSTSRQGLACRRLKSKKVFRKRKVDERDVTSEAKKWLRKICVPCVHFGVPSSTYQRAKSRFEKGVHQVNVLGEIAEFRFEVPQRMVHDALHIRLRLCPNHPKKSW